MPSISSFSFVRDPYARIVSGWHDKIVNRGPGGGNLKPDEREKLLNFGDFVHWVSQQDPVSINKHYRPSVPACSKGR